MKTLRWPPLLPSLHDLSFFQVLHLDIIWVISKPVDMTTASRLGDSFFFFNCSPRLLQVGRETMQGSIRLEYRLCMYTFALGFGFGGKVSG